MLKQIHKLCKPSYVYLVLSAITIILMMVQNAGASGTYKVGMYQCPCNNTAGIFLGKAIYVAFWTFILDAVCKAGYKSVSWFLVLFPMILGAVLVGLVLMSGGIREGIDEAAAVPGGVDDAADPVAGDAADPVAGDAYDYRKAWNGIAAYAALEGTLFQAGLNTEKNKNVGANIRGTVNDRAEARDKLRAAYISTMEDRNLSDEPEGNKLIMFFQRFFEKLVNFLTGKGFQNETEEAERRATQTERGRKLLEIKKQQAESPKNTYHDELDRFVADPSKEMTTDIDGNLTALRSESLKEYKELVAKAMGEEANKLVKEAKKNSEKGETKPSNDKKISFPKDDEMNSFEFIPTRRQQEEELLEQRKEEEGGEPVAAEQTYNNTDSTPENVQERERLNNTQDQSESKPEERTATTHEDVDDHGK